MLKGEALEAFINQKVRGRSLDKLGKPFGAVATDLAAARWCYFASATPVERYAP